MTETDSTSPENLIPNDKKGNELWKWLKELLRKAAKKFTDPSVPDDDPDKKDAKKILKNIKAVTGKIAEKEAEARARGEDIPEDPIDEKIPPRLRNVLDALHVEDFIDNHQKDIIRNLANVTEGFIGIDAGIINIGFVVAHATGADRIIARRIAHKIRDEIAMASRALAILHGPDSDEAQDAQRAIRQLDALTNEAPETPEPPKTPEAPTNRRDRDNAAYEDEEYSKYSDEGRLAARLAGRMSKEDLEWFDALKSPEKFSNLFDARVGVLMNEGKKEKKYSEPEAQVEASDEITAFAMNALITIYAPILDEEPKNFFDDQAKDAGTYNDNPYNAARTFSRMLNSLREKSEIDIHKVQGDTTSPLLSNKYRRLDRETVVVHDDSVGQLVERTMPSTKKSKAKIGEFAEYLREVFETGEDTISYGHNFKLLTTLGPREGPRGTDPFFAQIKQQAKRFTADKIDTTFRLPYNDVVQAAKQKFQSSYARKFVEYQWQKDPSMLGRFLQSMPEAERRVKDELREQFKGREIPEWALEWAFQTGRTMYFGLDFGFHEMVSYADPNLQYNGSASLTGLGGMRGYFDMFETAKMLSFKKDQVLAGAVWTPYTVNMGEVPYDWEEWRKQGKGRWEESFVLGQAAYAGSFLENQQLFIDMGNYLHTGGWGTNQGWRIREGYNAWLLPEFKGSTLNRLEAGSDSKIFVNSWKRIENIGIPIAENFWQQQIRDKAAGKGADQKKEFVDAVEELGAHFFDRYFSDGKGNINAIGSELLHTYIEEYNHEHPGHSEKERDIFLHHIKHVLTDRHYDGARDEALDEIMNKVATVLTLEQMPAHFVTMEKQRMTEYGVTLLSEIQAQFLPNAGSESVTPETRKEAKKRVDDALANIVFSQEQLRMDASKSMDENLETNHNLYGDEKLTTVQSTILDGQGNILTEDYIFKVLIKRFGLTKEEGQNNSQIRDAIALYKTIHARVTATPALAEVRGNSAIDKLFKDATGARAKSKRQRSKKEQELVERVEAIEDKATNGKFRSRIAWWSHALDKNYFGHSVTQPSVAMKFINVSAGGPDVVERDADQAAKTAELMHTQTGVLYKALKEAGQLGHEKGIDAGYEPLEAWIATFKGPIQGELNSGPAYEMSFRMAQLIDIFFKKDDAANAWWKLGPQRYWARRAKTSFSDSLIDEGAPLMSWNHKAEAKWAKYLHHKGKLKLNPSKGHKHISFTPTNKLYKTLIKIPGIKQKLEGMNFRKPDYANTFGYHDLAEWSNSGVVQLIKNHYWLALVEVLIGLGIFAGKQGTKDIDIT